MHTVRVSKTDPRAYPSARAAIEDTRLRNLPGGIYLHVEPGLYEEPVTLSYPGPLLVVPTHGPGTVEFAVTGDHEVFTTGHPLELYGVAVRNDSEIRSPVRVEGDGRLKAADCRFVGLDPLRVWGRGRSEFVNCRFEGTGVSWREGEGLLLDCDFDRGRLGLTNGAAVVARSLRFTGFEGGGIGASTLHVSGARAEITDCVITDCWVAYSEGRVGAAAVNVSQGAQVTFEDLSVRGDRGNAVEVRDGETRVVFTRLSVDGGLVDRYTVFVTQSAEVHLADSRVVNDHGAGVKAVDSTLVLDGLTVEDTGQTAIQVVRSTLRGRGLVMRRIGLTMLSAFDSKTHLSDVELREQSLTPETNAKGESFFLEGAVYMREGELELEGVRASDLAGWLLDAKDGRARLSSVRAERVHTIAMSGKGGMVLLCDVRSTGGRGNQLCVASSAFLEASNSYFEGSDYALAYADDAGITLRSTVLKGARGCGLLVSGTGAALLEGSEIRDCGREGIYLQGDRSRARVVRSTITGNGRYGIAGPAESVVETEDSVICENELGEKDLIHASGE